MFIRSVLLVLLCGSTSALAISAPAVEEKVEEVGKKVERIGISLDYFGENSHLSGEQWINNFRSDESRDYHAGPLATTIYLLAHPTEHVRIGPAVRFLGDYGEQYTFGYLGEVAATVDASFRAFELVDLVITARAGVSMLVPEKDFANEIQLRQAQGADVWNLPRLGWVASIGAGARRKLIGNLYAKLDVSGALGHQWLFATDQIVDGLRFRKYWGTDIQRMQVSLGLEVAL